MNASAIRVVRIVGIRRRHHFINGPQNNASGIVDHVVPDCTVVAAVPKHDAIWIIGERVAGYGRVLEAPSEHRIQRSDLGHWIPRLRDGQSLRGEGDGITITVPG